MTTEQEISRYLESLPAPRQGDMRKLHGIILAMNPGCRRWFLDGKDQDGKVVSNPGIGYGAVDKQYASGKTREMFQVGISANSAGLSVYLMGMDDRKHLPTTYGDAIGKANVSGYCIRFRALKDVDLDTLGKAIQDGFERTHA